MPYIIRGQRSTDYGRSLLKAFAAQPVVEDQSDGPGMTPERFREFCELVQNSYARGEIEREEAIKNVVQVGQISRDTAEKLFSEITTTPNSSPTPEVNMDLNQLATELRFSSDSIKVLGTMPASDQEKIQTLLETYREMPGVLEAARAEGQPVGYDEEFDTGPEMDWGEIGSVLRMNQDVVKAIGTFPPNAQDLIKKALQQYIDNGGQAAAFSEKPRGMSPDRYRELLSYSSTGQQILNKRRPLPEAEKRSPSAVAAAGEILRTAATTAAAFSSKPRTNSCMTQERRAELLGYTGLGTQIHKSDKVSAAAFSAKSPTAAQRRREVLNLSGQAARTLKYQQR